MKLYLYNAENLKAAVIRNNTDLFGGHNVTISAPLNTEGKRKTLLHSKTQSVTLFLGLIL